MFPLMTEDLPTRLPVFYTRGPQVSIIRQILNFLGCLAILPVYYLITSYSRFPLTLDLLLSVFVAEYNRYANEMRRQRVYTPPSTPAATDLEKAADLLPSSHIGPDCIAVVVGYREDPELFGRALQSYKTAEGCRFTLVGVDGEQGPDMEMVQVFQKVL
jgi:hyaluronan synthase